MKILEGLNESQKEAVLSTEGPNLIIAGAGSGKTKTLTHKVAYLIGEKKVKPGHILAVTFTNKAAEEVRIRSAQILGRNVPRGYEALFFRDEMPFVGTFHSFCVRILRQEAQHLGFDTNFVIFDETDKKAALKKILNSLDIDTDKYHPAAIGAYISGAKNELMDEKQYAEVASDHFQNIVSDVYVRYQKYLKEHNAFDFDDLIMKTVQLFNDEPKILEKYQKRFQYVLVDEYQDTNEAQYQLVKLLAGKKQNLTVVGDDWQSIYAWRGANYHNILNFEKDYSGTKVFKLEQNYRSSQNILDLADHIIKQNENRTEKKLWTEQGAGEKALIYQASNEKDEARFVIDEIDLTAEKTGAKLDDFVVLYRTNVQSRALEEAMLKRAIPYRVIGGVRFYARQEIKDMLAYLRLIHNEKDLSSFERIINVPTRGVGNKTFGLLAEYAKEREITMVEAVRQADENEKLNGKILQSLLKFGRFYEDALKNLKKVPLSRFIKFVFEGSGYASFLDDKTEEGEVRAENVKELLTVAGKYDYLKTAEEALPLFLEEVALLSDIDEYKDKSGKLTLMTLHAAKGLEFPYVFIVGIEEGLLPHSRSMLSPDELEEERRLMYVGITRAKKRVHLSYAYVRNIYGSLQSYPPSRFLNDLPEELIEKATDDLELSDDEVSQALEYQELWPGDKIRHPKFGEGIVTNAEDDYAEIAFAGKGVKRIALAFSQLEKIG